MRKSLISDVRLVLLSREALEALVRGDLGAASRAAGVTLPAAFLKDERLWRMRLEQLIAAPETAGWLLRAVVAESGAVVGYVGFHGPPDPDGMVEIGYTILREYRRRGHARAAADALLTYARDHGAVTARASVSPDNDASLSLVRSSGFVHVGEQWDEEDGLELVFERPLTDAR
jgi:ribosomal-protein-alanine N-acetyltransferase